MNILVAGPGAVGGYFGAKLANAGNNVTFLARGKCFDVLNSTGLNIKSFKGDFSIKVNAVKEVDRSNDFDLVLMCVKSYDTEKCMNQIKSAVKNETVILSLQNGVENAENIKQITENNNVLAGVVFILTEVIEPWTINHSASGKIIFGELDGTITERTATISNVFKNADIEYVVTDNIQKELWKKLIWNAAFNSVTALTNSVTKDILDVQESKRLVIEVMKETLNVAAKLGHNIDPQVIDEYVTLSSKPGSAKTSMRQDMLKGKRLEVEAINGAVLRFGEKTGVQTPNNNVLYSLLKLININIFV